MVQRLQLLTSKDFEAAAVTSISEYELQDVVHNRLQLYSPLVRGGPGCSSRAANLPITLQSPHLTLFEKCRLSRLVKQSPETTRFSCSGNT